MIQGATKIEGKITIFQLNDDLTTDRVKPFLKKMHELMNEDRILMVLDLGNVEDVSLLGMVALSSIFNKCRQLGGSMKIANLTPPVRRAFRSTNLINTIEVFEEVIDAIKSFRSHNLLKAKSYSGSFYVKERNSFVGWDRLPLTGPVQ